MQKILNKNSNNDEKYNYFKLASGPLIFFLIVYILPLNAFSYASKGAIGTMLWMAAWWIFRPVHIGITGLLPIITNSLFNFVPVDDIIGSYASPIIILLLGADLITVSWELWGLDKRIALRALCLIGTTVKEQLIVWFTVSTILTIFLPNVVVVAVLTPIAISMFNYLGWSEGIKNNKICIAISLAIAWGAGLGGFGSPLGGAMNLIAIEYIENQIIGREYMFWTWTTRMIPMLIVICIPILLYLMSFKFETDNLPGSKKFFKEKYIEMDKITKAEQRSFLLFIIAVVVSFIRPLYQDLLPSLVPSYVFLIIGCLTFIIPGNNGKRLSNWNYASSKLMWGLFLLFGGGIAIGKFISISGAGNTIAQLFTEINVSNNLLLIAIISLLGIILSNISSNTAAVAILTPIVGSVMISMGLNPIPYIYLASVACNCAFVLPTSVRAIPVGYGLDPQVLFSKGLMAVLLSFLTVTIFGYLAIVYWAGFSIA